MAFPGVTRLSQKNGMTNHYLDSRKKSLSHRIADLIFMLNQLEKKNPYIYPNGTTHHFEYRLSQYQKVKYPDAE